MPSVLEALVAARKNIESPESWTKGSYARRGKFSSSEFLVAPNSEQAICFCAVGALLRVLNLDSFSPGVNRYLRPLDSAFMEIKRKNRWVAAISVEGYNDHPAVGHDDILNLYDRAIQIAKEQK